MNRRYSGASVISTRHNIFCWLTLAVLVVVIYGASLNAPLMFDDIPNLVDNPSMGFDPVVFEGWRVAILSGQSGALLRPLSMASFALNHSLGSGFDPASLKAVNLVIHLLCAWLVYRLAQCLFSALGQYPNEAEVNPLALLAAAVWVLHPMHVSTVLYAVQRMAQLSTLFVLLGLVVYSRYRCRWLRQFPQPGEVLALLLWGALITCLAMLSKENGVLLPWLALVLEAVVFRGRMAGRAFPALQIIALVLLVLPLAAVMIVYLASPSMLTGGFEGRGFTLQERVLTQLRILWHYVYWFAWPDIRNMGFQHDDIVLSRGWWQPLTTLVAGAAWVGLLVVASGLRKRFPLLLLGVTFYLVAHALESTVLPLELAFEHRNYLPTVGLALLAAGLVGGLWQHLPQVRPRVMVASLLSVLALLLMTRCYIWSDMARFTRTNAINHPDSVRAQFFYADALYSQIGRDGASADTSDVALLLAAREQFIKVNELAGGHSTALVMLYLADAFYLPGLDDRPDWLAELGKVLLKDAKFTASDYSAIQSLAACAVRGVCERDRQRILQLIDALLVLSPGNYRFLEQRYQLAAAAGMDAERLDSLDQLSGLAPQVPVMYSYLVTESAAAGNTAAVYAAMAGWMRHDRVRKDLALLRLIAGKQASLSGPTAPPPAKALGER